MSTDFWEKQPPKLFYKKKVVAAVLRNFFKFAGKHLCQSPLFNKVAGLLGALFLLNISG